MPRHRFHLLLLLAFCGLATTLSAAERTSENDERLRKAFELSEMTKQLFFQGLRKRFPDLPDDELKRVYLERLAKCHNRNY